MTEVGYLVAVFLSGGLVGLALGRRLQTALVLSMGAAVGVSVFSLGMLVCFLLAVPVRPGVLLAVVPLAAAGAAFWMRRGTLTRKEAMTGTAALLIASLFAVLLCQSDLSVFSYDSIVQVLASRAIGHRGGLTSEMHGLLGSWGALFFLAQSPAVDLGRDLLPSLFPFLGLGIAATTAVAFHGELKEAGLSASRAGLVAAFFTFAVFSTYGFVLQSVYVHNTVLAAACLFSAVVALWQSSRTMEPGYLGIAGILLVGFSLSRIEAPLFCFLLLVAVWLASPVPLRPLVRLTAALGVCVGAWYLFLVRVISAGGDILTPGKAVFLSLPLAALAVVQAALGESGRQRYRRSLVGIGGILAVALSVVFLALKPSQMGESLRSMLGNFHAMGRWGIGWHIGLALAGLAYLTPDRRRPNWILGFVFTACWLVWALSYFRAPYRHGFGDSANRICTSFFALLYFFGALGIASAVREALTVAAPPHRRRLSRLWSDSMFGFKFRRREENCTP